MLTLNVHKNYHAEFLGLFWTCIVLHSLISFELPMGFQNFVVINIIITVLTATSGSMPIIVAVVVINKIHPKK